MTMKTVLYTTIAIGLFLLVGTMDYQDALLMAGK